MNDLNPISPPDQTLLKATYHKLTLYLSDLDETEQKAIHHDWRYRLIQFSETLMTSPRRLDWFFHQLMQEQDLIKLISLVHEFNSLQLKDLSENQDDILTLDIFQMEIQQAGLILAKKTYTQGHTDGGHTIHSIHDTTALNSLCP